MPKLLSLNSYHYKRGGSDAVYFEHDNLFHSVGWDTAFFSMHHPSNEPTEWSSYFVDELEFGAQYSLFSKLKMAGKVIYSWEAVEKLGRLLDHWEPDIAHAHCIYHHLSPSILSLLKSRGIPTVMTAHDFKIACPAYKMFNKNGICEKCKNGNLLNVIGNRCIHDSLSVSALVMFESMIHKALGLYRKNLDRVIVPSRFFGDKLREWGWPEEQLLYIPNYVHAEMYEPSYEPGNYMLYFGRLAPEKGLKTLIAAAAKAGIRLKIVGIGPEEKALLDYAQQTGGDIDFLGFCKKDVLWPLVKQSRTVVLPSEWYENAPMSLLEAYALGKIVIGANIGGIPELIEHGQTGYLFESGNVDELADYLSTANSMSDAQIVKMGKQARQYIVTKFTLDHYSQAMQVLYSSLGAPIAEPHRQSSLHGLS
ncbi:MAG: glycosyltransferase [Candidatus Thiodiazotropha sp. (ex Ustalcina ferruginea)]|nr:glycosyltransferase [Candidatus Thiodiazotropha sp. (ex Ustalcina ferruginea)]